MLLCCRARASRRRARPAPPPPPPPPARRACARPSLRAACVQYSVGEPVHVYFAPHAPPQSLAANGPLASGTQRDTGEPAQTKRWWLLLLWSQRQVLLAGQAKLLLPGHTSRNPCGCIVVGSLHAIHIIRVVPNEALFDAVTRPK